MTESLLSRLETARLRSEWNEDVGDVLWWKFPIDEPPYVGTPLDSGYPVEIIVQQHHLGPLLKQIVMVGGWPGYHTHWTPIKLPKEPASD